MFEITERKTADVIAVTSRQQNAGEDKVPGISVRLSIKGPNTMLDALGVCVRPAIYERDENQIDIPGVIATTPNRRSKLIERYIVTAKFVGWTLHVVQATSEPLIYRNCTVHKFEVVPVGDGGSIELSFLVSTADIDVIRSGHLVMKNGDQLDFLLTAPKDPDAAAKAIENERKNGRGDKNQTVIDGTKGHPAAGGVAADPDKPDATAQIADAMAAAGENETGDGVVEGTNRTTSGAIGQP